MEKTQSEFDRRSAILLGIAGAATLIGANVAKAEEAPSQELAPGVTLKVLREVDPEGPIPGYVKARLIEITFQPGAVLADPNATTAVDICEIQGAPLYVEMKGKDPFTLNVGDIYACPVGTIETDTNKGDKPSIMRVIELQPA